MTDFSFLDEDRYIFLITSCFRLLNREMFCMTRSANIRITGNGTLNGADSVGGIYCFHNKTVTFESGTIQNCTATSGGGVRGAETF